MVTSTVKGRCAGRAAATTACRRCGSAAAGSGTRRVTRRPGCGKPGNGPRGRADQVAPPLSVISGRTPKASWTASDRPRRVPRTRCSETAVATARRRVASASVPSSLGADPGRQPVDEVLRRESGREVGLQAVQDVEERGEDDIEALDEALGEVVVGEDGGQRRAQGVRGQHPRRGVPLIVPRSRGRGGRRGTAAADGASSMRSVASPRRPVSGSAGCSRTSSTSSTPGTRWRAAKISPDRSGRPNGQPSPCAPPVSGSRWRTARPAPRRRTRSAPRGPEGVQRRDDRDALVEGRAHREPGADQAALVQEPRDPAEEFVAGHQLLEAEPAAGVGDRLGDDQDPDGVLTGPARRAALARSAARRTRPVRAPRDRPPGRRSGPPRGPPAAPVPRSRAAVTARSWARSVIGARTLASSTVSPSTPPRAASRFSTRATYGMELRSTWIAPRATLPDRPPPVR